MIEVPSQDVVKFLRELLMVQQEESALREAEAAEESSLTKKEVEEEGQEEKEDGKDTPEKVCDSHIFVARCCDIKMYFLYCT